MTNVRNYRNELCNEFIKNEEDWISRSANIDELKKAKKIREREEHYRRKNNAFFLSIALILIMISVVLGALGYTISLMIPKNIDTIENMYEVTYYSYVVAEGENLHIVRNKIMKTHSSMFEKVNRWNYDSLLIEINEFDNPDEIYPGETIIYPVF